MPTRSIVQAETAQLVLDRGGNYLFALKANRPAMLADVEAFFADPAGAVESHTTTDADHGRIEVRRHAVSHAVAWLFSDRRYPHEPAFPGLATIGMVESETERDGRTMRARRYYLSSAHLDAAAFARAVRAHWAIENALYWVLDTGFDEDRARTAKITDRKISPSCESLPLTSCEPPDRKSRSAESANAPDGPMPSPSRSSAKCDSPALPPQAA